MKHSTAVPDAIEVKVSSFPWAMQMVFEGKKVKQCEWVAGGYIHLNNGWLLTDDGFDFSVLEGDFTRKWELAE